MEARTQVVAVVVVVAAAEVVQGDGLEEWMIFEGRSAEAVADEAVKPSQSTDPTKGHQSTV